MREQRKMAFWILVILGLAVQSITIVTLILLIQLTKDLDSIAFTVNGVQNNFDEHLGYIIFGFIGVGTSIICYLFIMLTAILYR